MKESLRQAKIWIPQMYRRITNPIRTAALQRQRSFQIHLGCGGDRLPDFVNIDSRLTPATDIMMDLNSPRLAPGSVSVAFSNAFFEHLYLSCRLPHLRTVYAALEINGVCCYIGIPYFRNIAKFYLERSPGTSGQQFDLSNVYRYTHGAPERFPTWWLGQLHKSLFDEEELASLLSCAGFPSFVMFCYAYPGDVHELPVSMGFYASRHTRSVESLQTDCLSFLQRFADVRIRLGTLQWL